MTAEADTNMNDLIREGRARSIETRLEWRRNDPMRRRWREEQAAAPGPSSDEVLAEEANQQIRKVVAERKKPVDLREVRSNG